ncbi:DUF2497 domain-containing protein [Roseomonas populi]|uniref:DUF2497 domain-containing protein n=1 Tax=Roseomonas populi TaxID=3121582 RepID=A0ABT1WZR3_9PROT|nr:DUF2497 domain-containing protein [Roseomonas pecuniae]MCR0981335.1 DUF2497 domain-containing protein [Roseomonas pecuniae]
MSGAATPPGQDPSMEDILASIRKILNEEEAAPAAEASPAPQAREAGREPEPPPLELTEAMLVSVPAEARLPDPPPPEPAPEPQPVEPPALTPLPMPAPLPDALSEGLVAPATAAATAALIGQLARTVAAERAAPVHRGGPSIEDVVREEMRPLLKEWMDAHLPAMVERLVRAEIERVVNRSLG